MAAQHHGRRLVLQFGGDAQRELRSDALRAPDRRLGGKRERPFEFARAERREDIERHTAADILHRLQQTEPLAFFGRVKAVKPDRVFRHFRFDHERNVRTGREFRKRRGGTLHEIADAGDIDDRMILRDRIHHAGELSDHGDATIRRARVPARWACAMAQASASAASACSTPQVGSRRRTIACTCSFCAWPTPTTDFLMWLVAYSAISSPACAAASKAIARAWPSLSAAEGSLATKACSTAMADGPCSAITFSSARCSASRRSPRPSAAPGAMTPCATGLRRRPETAIP